MTIQLKGLQFFSTENAKNDQKETNGNMLVLPVRRRVRREKRFSEAFIAGKVVFFRRPRHRSVLYVMSPAIFVRFFPQNGCDFPVKGNTIQVYLRFSVFSDPDWTIFAYFKRIPAFFNFLCVLFYVYARWPPNGCVVILHFSLTK